MAKKRNDILDEVEQYNISMEDNFKLKETRKGWIWQIASINKLKDKLTKKNKRPSPIYLLLCSVDCSISTSVIEFLNDRKITHHLVLSAEAKTGVGVKEAFGAYSSTKELILAVADANLCENIVLEVTQKFELDCEKNDFVCLLKPNSASLEVLQLILGKYSLKEKKNEKN